MPAAEFAVLTGDLDGHRELESFELSTVLDPGGIVRSRLCLMVGFIRNLVSHNDSEFGRDLRCPLFAIYFIGGRGHLSDQRIVVIDSAVEADEDRESPRYLFESLINLRDQTGWKSDGYFEVRRMQEGDGAEIGHLYLAGSREAVYGEDLVMVARPFDSLQQLFELSKKGSYLLVRWFWRRGRLN